MKERYEVIKKLYPNYLILIRYKDKLKTFKEDKIIYNYINKNINKYHINYIILNKLDIEKIKEYSDNNYINIYFKIKIINLLKNMKEGK